MPRAPKHPLTVIDPENYRDGDYLSEDPTVRIYRDFLSNEEIDYLMKYLTTKKFTRSGTEEDFGEDAQTSDYRTSYTYFIPESNPFSRKVKRRVAKMLNCRVTDIEPLQIVRYKEGQYYKTHHDSHLDEEGLHRDHTYFVYLNTIRNGSGGTTFPYLRLQVQPRKGCAVYWKNLKNGDCDGRLRHRGDVVKDAQKYGMNVWVRTPRQDEN